MAYFDYTAALGGSCEVLFPFELPFFFWLEAWTRRHYDGLDVAEKHRNSAYGLLVVGDYGRNQGPSACHDVVEGLGNVQRWCQWNSGVRSHQIRAHGENWGADQGAILENKSSHSLLGCQWLGQHLLQVSSVDRIWKENGIPSNWVVKAVVSSRCEAELAPSTLCQRNGR